MITKKDISEMRIAELQEENGRLRLEKSGLASGLWFFKWLSFGLFLTLMLVIIF